ncbi:surfeit locus protein 1 [Halyomorpha halys]|uniref:surfeit locus protein 1 n=1 Tax=Halyomorpha halys TaxID=286706 RepID=UPI0006D5240F|nr:surfeit locus protein 1 [Halyomorpha halys]
MNFVKFTRAFAICKCRTSTLATNSAISNSLRKFSTHKFENNIHKIERFPSGRISNVKKDDGPAYLLLIIPISAFFLGTWQVKRKKWKEELIEGLRNITKIPPVSLPTELSEIAEMEFRRVTITGEFDHSGEMYLGPRSLLVDGESTYSGKLVSSAGNGSSGYYVITPFIRSDTKEKILVNRGWVSFSQKNPKLRENGQIKGEVEINGVIRHSEGPPSFGPTKKEDVRIWFVRNVEQMAEMAGAEPIFIDASADTTVPGGPIGGQTRASFRNEHLSYILTWYSLSAATGLMWYMKYIKKVY